MSKYLVAGCLTALTIACALSRDVGRAQGLPADPPPAVVTLPEATANTNFASTMPTTDH